MLSQSLLLQGLLALGAYAKSSTTDTATDLVTLSGTISTTVTGSYATGTSQVTNTNTVVATSTSTDNSTTTDTSLTKGTTSYATLLVGGVGIETLTIINGTTTIYPDSTTTTKTATSSTATNTQACNMYTEFCDRKYSNITQVCAHNSAFVKKGNAASNQAYTINYQLDDGIRMIQGETHWVNDTVYSCHTSCDLLNVGTYEAELTTVREWVEDHPYDVVTLLIVNSDYVNVEDYVSSFEGSGILDYMYIPPKIPMHLDDWPTLSEMILSGKRVVAFMDYEANQTAVNYILDEFTHMFETPFSPQDIDFPCTIQRPPTLTNKTIAEEEYMYLANHNLNQAVTLLGDTLLLPNTADLNVTNSAGLETGNLGLMAENCSATYAGRAPTWLLVDFYNVGSGSVFEVAAKWNNVTYDRKCCGAAVDSAAINVSVSSLMLISAVLVASSFFIML